MTRSKIPFKALQQASLLLDSAPVPKGKRRFLIPDDGSIKIKKRKPKK